LEEIRRKLKTAQRQEYDLQSSSVTLATDYLTQEEMATFRKPLRKKKKVIRKKEKTALVELDSAASEIADHGSRTSKSSSADDEQQRQEQRKRNYEKALIKAEEDSKALKIAVVAPADVDEEDDLYESLARAKKAAKTQQVLPKLEAVAKSAAKRREEDKREKQDNVAPKLEDLEDQTDSIDSELVFSATSEFVRHLKSEPAEEMVCDLFANVFCSLLTHSISSIQEKRRNLHHLSQKKKQTSSWRNRNRMKRLRRKHLLMLNRMKK
jgi:U4/U6.U5 tri-snRNP-associated protein 1